MTYFRILLLPVVFIGEEKWKFLAFKYFGILTKDGPDENEDEMKYDAFFCYRFVQTKFYRLREVDF